MTLESQPIDSILKARGLGNGDLVKASTEQLTFKQVQKARQGRRVTVNIQDKIVRALNACSAARYQVGDLFNLKK